MLMKLIDKSALVAEIEKIYRRYEKQINSEYMSKADFMCIELKKFLSLINTLEVKEVDLEEEIQDIFQKYKNGYNGLLICKKEDFSVIAKYFFELGLRVNNPITASDRGTVEEIIVNLKRVEKDYRINLTKEKEWLRNKVKKGV